MKNGWKDVKYLLMAVREVVSALPWHMTALFALLLLAEGAITGLFAKVLQNFFDTLTAQAGVPDGFRPILLAGLLLGGMVLLTHALNGLHDILFTIVRTKSAGTLTEKLNLKTGRLNPICFDDPASLVAIEKTGFATWRMFATFFTFMNALFLYLTNFIIMGRYLFLLDPILCIMPIVVFIPIILTQIARTTAFSKLEDAAAPIRRETNYYQDCVGRRELFKETRVLHAFGYFKGLYTAALDMLSRETWRAERKGAWLDLISKALSLAGFGLVLYLLVRAAATGVISIGAFAAVFAAINTMFSMMENLVLQEIGWISREFGYVRNYFAFMNLPERRGDNTPLSLDREIQLENVSFRYPGKEHDSLRNISLTIPAGQTIAVLGENGSGKSTLVKMLLGIYLPQSGTVSYDGRDIAMVSCAGLTHKTSAVFQDYMRYKVTLKDNIAISDLTHAQRDSGYSEEINSLLRHTTDDPVSVQATELLAQMEIDCQDTRYPNGIVTLLDREFGGIDLSGGQWQKVAIARGLFRRHHLIALDEPTAAIDPIEESRLYRQFMEISRGVTSVIVTHRLGSARIAERIIVLDKGEIVQTGTHDELLGVPGKYSEMWKAQAQYYR
ncbi:ABC transporter ATP-binding protein [Paenibacillus sp. MBLB4367]|uniref:ABC transporter ATP-binding protein n=1 Tax=Paenibacillus sp. MBLB4367 TaxID=3384767 RepID=UPI0039080CBA